MAYRIGHVPGSVNIRDDYLEDMLRHGIPFPPSRKIVFICPAGEYAAGIKLHPWATSPRRQAR
jgi:cysteine synthase B